VSRPSSSVVVVLLGVIVAGALYEAAVAGGVVPIGTVPGEGPRGEEYVLLAGVGALLATAVVVAFVAVGVLGPFAAGPLLPLAGAAFAFARWYSYDPYYLPTLRRASEGGLVPASWMAGLVLLSLLAAALSYARPRPGAALTVVALTLSAVTAFAAQLGH
jgi:hypothetical protein